MTKRSIERRLSDLEADPLSGSGPDSPQEIIINDSLVTDRDAEPIPFARTRIWRDATGAWRSERTDLRDRPESEDS